MAENIHLIGGDDNGIEDLDALVENAFGIDDREFRSARLDSTLSESKATLVSNSFNPSLDCSH